MKKKTASQLKAERAARIVDRKSLDSLYRLISEESKKNPDSLAVAGYRVLLNSICIEPVGTELFNARMSELRDMLC